MEATDNYLKSFAWNELPPEIQEIITSYNFETWMCVSWTHYNSLLPLLGRGEVKEYDKVIQFPTYSASLCPQALVGMPQPRDTSYMNLPMMTPYPGGFPVPITELPEAFQDYPSIQQQRIVRSRYIPRESHQRIYNILLRSQRPTTIQTRYILDRIRRVTKEELERLDTYIIVSHLTDLECIRAHIQQSDHRSCLPYAMFNFMYLRELLRLYTPGNINVSDDIENILRQRPSGISPDQALAFVTCVGYPKIGGVQLSIILALKIVDQIEETHLQICLQRWLTTDRATTNRRQIVSALINDGYIRVACAMIQLEYVPLEVCENIIEKILVHNYKFDTELVGQLQLQFEDVNYNFGSALDRVFENILAFGDPISDSMEKLIIWMIQQPGTHISQYVLRALVSHRYLFPHITDVARAASENPSVSYRVFKEIYEKQMKREYYMHWASYYRKLLNYCENLANE